MRLMSDLIPMKLYSSKRKVMLPVDMKDKKHGSAVFLMGQTMEENERILNLSYLFKGDKLFRAFYIDRNVANYIDSTSINDKKDDIQEESSIITEGIIHTDKDKFVFKNTGTMDEKILKAIYNKKTLKWCMLRLGMSECPVDEFIIYLHPNINDLQKSLKKKIDMVEGKQMNSYTIDNVIHILPNTEYDEKDMDGPYDAYCIHELLYCLIINKYPAINRKIAVCTAMALSGQIEWLRKEKKTDEFKYYDSEKNHVDGLYVADVIYQLYETKGGYGIRKFLEGDTSYFYSIAGRRVRAFFNSSLKESLVEGTLTAKQRAKLKDSDYGIPSKKKYPMPDEAHVKAAIRMFNHCDEEDEAELAKAIKRKMKEFNITDIKISDKNRLSKYITEGVIIDEGYFISKDDTEYNLDLWKKSNGHNILYITGLSGGGKSTLANEISNKYNAIYIELDKIENAHNMENPIYQDEKYISNYLKANHIKTFKEFEKFEKRMDSGEREKYLIDCMKYMISEMKKDKNNLYVVEGIQIINYCHFNKDLFNEPMIIKNTSMIKSIIRRKKRDGEIVVGYHLADPIIWYLDQERSLNCLRKDAKSFNESTLDQEHFNIKKSVININELSVNNKLDKDHKKKGNLNLSSFKAVKIDDEICEKYNLNHVDTSINCSGKVWLDNDKLVCYLNTKEKDGVIWIQGLEVSNEYQSQGLSSQLLRVAKSEYKVTNLSVNKKNQIAYNLYKKNGFKEYKETSKMIFMSTIDDYKEAASVQQYDCGIPFLDYKDNGNPIIGGHRREYYDVLQVLSTLSLEEFKIVSLFPVYRDSVAIKKRIVLKDPNEVPMAFMDVYWFEQKPHEAQITTAVSKYYRGHNLCSMMLKELLESDFAEEYGVHTFVWNAHPDNEASKKIALSKGFKLKSEEIDNLGRQRYEYRTPVYDKTPKINLEKIPESTILLNEFSGIIFKEADDIESKYDKKLRRYLYKERLKNNRAILPIYEKIKANHKDIDRTYRELKLYKGQNVYVDTSYYHDLYLQNVNIKSGKRAIYMYLDFLTRLMDNQEFKSQYHKFTYFFPVFNKGIDLLDWKTNINILSAINYLIKKDPDRLKKWGNNKSILFLGEKGYFTIDFNNFTNRNMIKFKSHINKLLSNSPIIDNDPIDNEDVFEPETDEKGSAIAVIDKIEKSSKIVIDDLTKVGSVSRVGHLIMNTSTVPIDKKSEENAILIITPNTTTFNSEVNDRNLRSNDIIACYRPSDK